MKQDHSRPCLAFTVTLWVLGLFAGVQILLLAGSIKRENLRINKENPKETLVPVVVTEQRSTSEAARSNKRQDATLEELIERLDIDLEDTVREATLKAYAQDKPDSSVADLDTSDATTEPALSEKFLEPLKAARLLRQKGDLARALLSLEKLIGEFPNQPALLYESALAYEDLGNLSTARKAYLEVFKLGHEAAGDLYLKATHKLNHGFGDPAAFLGKINIGHVREDIEKLDNGQQLLKISIPIQLTPGIEIDPSDLQIDIDFYDRYIDGSIVLSTKRGKKHWMHAPADWSNLEEILLVELKLPATESQQLELDGKPEHYGFIIKLFYKSEPLDAYASPRSLFLIRKKQSIDFFPIPDENFLDGGLLPEKFEPDPLPEIP